MARKKPRSNRKIYSPTPAELAILGVLWESGPGTVREIHAGRTRHTPIAYTTVLSMLQIMHQKGLVHRDARQRAHVYSAAVSRRQIQRRLLGGLLERAFSGSATELVMQALGSDKPASPEEIQRIRKRLDELESHKQ